MKCARRVAVAARIGLLLPTTIAVAGDRADFGALEVISTIDAPVFIEGIGVGRPPLVLPHLEPRTYRLVVLADDGDRVQDVEIRAGEITTVDPLRTAASDRGRSYRRDEDDWLPLLDADKRRYEKATVRLPLRRYPVLEIGNFLVKTDEVPSHDDLFSLLPMIAARLDRRPRFRHVVTNYTRGPSARWLAAAEAPAEPTVLLTGVLTRFRRGNMRVRIYCLFRLVDMRTGAVLLERMENGSVGEDSRKAFEELAGDIARVIERSW